MLQSSRPPGPPEKPPTQPDWPYPSPQVPKPTCSTQSHPGLSTLPTAHSSALPLKVPYLTLLPIRFLDITLFRPFDITLTQTRFGPRPCHSQCVRPFQLVLSSSLVLLALFFSASVFLTCRRQGTHLPTAQVRFCLPLLLILAKRRRILRKRVADHIPAAGYHALDHRELENQRTRQTRLDNTKIKRFSCRRQVSRLH